MKLSLFSKVSGLAGHFCTSYVNSFPGLVCAMFVVLVALTWLQIGRKLLWMWLRHQRTH